MAPFYVGMKVVCISDDWTQRSFFKCNYPVKGQIYTIEHLEEGDSASGVGLLFFELTNKPFWGTRFGVKAFREPTFDSYAFRPLIDTDISIFTSMLTTPPNIKVEV